MNDAKRKRLIAKLERLADPARNSNPGEAASAWAKLEALLAEDAIKDKVRTRSKARARRDEEESQRLVELYKTAALKLHQTQEVLLNLESKRLETESLLAKCPIHETKAHIAETKKVKKSRRYEKALRAARKAEAKKTIELEKGFGFVTDTEGVYKEKRRLHNRRESEPIGIQTLLEWTIKPSDWELSLFGFVCEINGCKSVYSPRGDRHLLRAVGRPTDAAKAGKQYQWAHRKVKDAPKTSQEVCEQRLQYEHGVAKELSNEMIQTCEVKPNKEAVKWAQDNLNANPPPKSTYELGGSRFLEGMKVLKTIFLA